MIDFGAWGVAVSEVMKWMNAGQARRKEAALKAADSYIDIDTTGTYLGEKLSDKREKDLKTHFRKQFNAWKAG